MPYLTFETLGGVRRMNSTIKSIRDGNGVPPNLNQGSTLALADSLANVRGSEERVLLAFLDPGATAEQDAKLQISRSLDEYYYHALNDDEREHRNGDQVIRRFQNRDTGKGSPESLICMVDQMWLYIIDERKFFYRFDSTVWSLPIDKLIAMARYGHHLFSSALARSWQSA